jgi:hypothetical protein
MKDKFACMTLPTLIHATGKYLRTEKQTFHSDD